MTAFTEPVAPPVKKSAVKTVKNAMHTATSVLKRPGNLPLMIASLLFLAVMLVTWMTVMQLLAIPINSWEQAANYAWWATVPLESLYWLLAALSLWVFVMPFALGRVRLAGRMCLGEMPALREIFYYYSSLRRFGRGLAVGFLLLLEALIPIGVAAGAFAAVIGLYNGFLVTALDPLYAILILLAGLLLAAGITLVVAPVCIFYMLSTAIAVGNEEISVLRALGLALKYAFKNLGTVCLFSLISLLHLILSLCTVGVLHLLWYGHHYIISYLCLAMALDQGD